MLIFFFQFIFYMVYIFFPQITKVYYVNRLSAGRVVCTMRCCHEMRVRVNVAIVFRCARVYSYWQLNFATSFKIDYVLKLFLLITMYINDAELIIKFLIYLIYDCVLWRVTDHCAAILDESTLSPTDTRTFRNNKKIKIIISHIFTLYNEFYCFNWVTFNTSFRFFWYINIKHICVGVCIT